MKRKIIRLGTATLVTSLPASWIKKHEIKPGDELDLEISGNDIILSQEKPKIPAETTIKLLNLTESSIRTLITNAYRVGYDKVNVIFDKEEQFNLLQQIVKTKLIGFDVIKKGKNSCVVENITEPSYDQFDNLLKKMFLNLHDLFTLTQNKLGLKIEGDFDDFEEVEERIMKYDNFCRRVISKQKLIKKNSEMFWTFLSLIVHASRELYHLNKIIKKGFQGSKETLNILSKTYEISKLIEQAYYSKNIEILAKIHEMEKDVIYKKTYKLLQSRKGKENIILYHLASCARQFYQANSPLAGLIV